MNSKPSYIIYVLVAALLIAINNRGYSQPTYKRGYEICVSNLIFEDLTFVYTQKLSNNKYIEIFNSFHPRLMNKGDENSNEGFSDDPYFLYNLYRFKIGIRIYDKNNLYLCPMIIFGYGYFDNAYVSKKNKLINSDYYWYKTNRTRCDIGFVFKMGKNLGSHKYFLSEIYWGAGLKYKYIHDTILEEEYDYYTVNNTKYPVTKYYWMLMPTFHFGYLFGYCR